jgi:ParB family chromosome partitioning protein
MNQGNKGFAELVSGAGQGTPVRRLPPRTGVLGSRENRLVELSEGGIATRVHESVDPATCRLWEGHNRDYAALSEEGCADLIASLKGQGRQEVPAIVRRVAGDPNHRFEVICGARRHWSVSWLRAHDYPTFAFLVEPRELTDEEAFRLADLENRSRKDLSDYERARDYERAIERYYDGNQQRMADRLEVTKSWMSRYLELARLPTEVVACFSSPHVIGISHAARLAPLLSHPRTRAKVLAEAAALLSEGRADGSGQAPAKVVARLVGACDSRRPAGKRQGREEVLTDRDGRTLLRIRVEAKGDIGFIVPASRLGHSQQILDAIGGHLSHLAEGAETTDDKRTRKRSR